jgi:asparagine synthase (glutamine-hydrolysing)
MSDVDIQVWLEGDIYLNVDKMSKAAGLEVRMPLTDLRVFDIASRMPSKFKVNSEDEHNKLALRRAAVKVLPEEIEGFSSKRYKYGKIALTIYRKGA